MKKNILRGFIFSAFVFVLSVGNVLAAPTVVDAALPTPFVGVVSIKKELPIKGEDSVTEENKTQESVLTFRNSVDDAVVFVENDEMYTSFITALTDSVTQDAMKGLEALKNTVPTRDYIELDTWGLFLSNYLGKVTSNFPIGDINLKFDGYDMTLKSSEDAKEWVKSTLTPLIMNAILDKVQLYPAYIYNFNVSQGCLLKDYVLDLTNIVKTDTIYPLKKLNSYADYIVSNTGDSLGLEIEADYVGVLRGYHSELPYKRSIEGNVPGCVDILSYVVLLKNVSGLTVVDKSLSDFSIYSNLAVNLDTGDLIDTTDMTTDSQQLNFSDYKLNLDNLLLVPIYNTVVVLQPTYLECFEFGGCNASTDYFLDVSKFIREGSFDVDLIPVTETESNKTITVNIKNYIDENGVMDVRLGGSPFLIYSQPTNYPYNRMILWAYSSSSGAYLEDEKEVTIFVQNIKLDLVAENRKADYNLYMKQAGKLTDTTKVVLNLAIIFLVVGLISTVIILIVVKKKKNNKANSNAVFSDTSNSSGLYFDDDDNDDDDCDFDLK